MTIILAMAAMFAIIVAVGIAALSILFYFEGYGES